MFCPNCGANVSATKFCENCGKPLPDNQATTPIEQPTEPVASSYVPEVPGDSAWQAQPQQAYQASQTAQMPPQTGVGDYVPYSGAPQPPYQQSVPYNPPTGAKAPNAAFVLVIVGLVLSLLFVTFIPGIVCSIIGLVLNASYNKNGLNNPRKTPTLVIGIIGIVVALSCLAFSIFVGVLTAEMIDEADQQGIDLTSDNVQVTTDSDGKLRITVTDSDSSASASATTTDKSSSAAASTSASASSAAATSSSAAAASSASESAAAGSATIGATAYDDAKYHDAAWNPTLYAVVELTGAEMSDLLESYNYQWDNDYEAWVSPDESMYMVSGIMGEYSKKQIESLPKGAAGEPVVLGLFVTGYDSPSSAFKALSKDVTVEDSYGNDDLFIGVVKNSDSVKYLAVAAEADDMQVILLFDESSISGGLFEDLLGIDAGSSVDDVWRFISTLSGR